jgi:hypothetical protein
MTLYIGENQPMTVKESRNRNSDAAFKKIIRISKRFQGSKQKLDNCFHLSKGSQNI